MASQFPSRKNGYALREFSGLLVSARPARSRYNSKYRRFSMTSLQINTRGGLTLPKPIRKLLGVDRGGVVMIECQKGSITLRPAVAFPVELYDDQRIAEFDEQDRKLGQYLKKHGIADRRPPHPCRHRGVRLTHSSLDGRQTSLRPVVWQTA